MTILRVTTTTVWNIDTDAYIAAALEADALTEGEAREMRADLDHLGEVATGYSDAEDHLPRWARDAMIVSATTTTERIRRQGNGEGQQAPVDEGQRGRGQAGPGDPGHQQG